MSKEVCSICGMGGYWVAYSTKFGVYRCVNHIDTAANDLEGD
jgi:hypothetical protein